MSNLSVFSFESQEVRFVDGKPVANDVAAVLGYADPAKTVSTKVKPKHRTVTKMVTVDGKLRDVTVLEEAGIYQLIFGSKLPSAEKFQDWVFEEVLPSIRKTGKYQRKSGQSAQQSPQWLEARQQGKDKRRCLTDSIKAYIERHPELPQNQQKFLYANSSEALNLGLFGQRSKQLKALLGLGKSGLLRDKLTSSENGTLSAIEFLACQLIEHEDLDPCLAVKKAIESSYSSKIFATKYLDYRLPQSQA